MSLRRIGTGALAGTLAFATFGPDHHESHVVPEGTAVDARVHAQDVGGAEALVAFVTTDDPGSFPGASQ